jgi:hypothetical protein
VGAPGGEAALQLRENCLGGEPAPHFPRGALGAAASFFQVAMIRKSRRAGEGGERVEMTTFRHPPVVLMSSPRTARLAGLAVLAAVIPLLLASSASAANVRVYHDPLDVTCCTRDFTDIRVSNTDAGTIAVDIHFDDTVEGTDDDDFYLVLDTDHNPATGQYPTGIDYRIWAAIPFQGYDSVTFTSWPNGQERERPANEAGVAFSSGRHWIRISFDRHLIGDVDDFNFLLVFEEVAIGATYDELAPNTGTWFFPVKLALGRLRPSLQTKPLPPRAGGGFSARLSLRVGGTHSLLASGKVLCAAAVGGAPLQARSRGFVARRAVCGWQLPHWARGKKLRGWIGVQVTSRARVARRFALRVR